MADLSNPKECAGFIRAWRDHYGADRADLFRRRMQSTAHEQRRNMENARSAGRNVEQYAESVAMLDKAARLATGSR